MCIPFPREIEHLIEEKLSIYMCKLCEERSVMVDGVISSKSLQPEGWGCDCTDNEFQRIELDTHGEA